MRGNTNACISSSGSAGGGGDEIEVINNTGKTIEAGDKVWVNILSDNTDTPLAKTGYSGILPTFGFTKDGQYLFTGGRLNKVKDDNTLVELKNYNLSNDYRIKNVNGRTYATSLNFTACINYPNNWDIDWAMINDGFFVNQYNNNIRKYDLETGVLIKEYTGNISQYDDGQRVVVDNVMYHLDIRRKYTFDDVNNTYSSQDYVVTINNTDNKSIVA